MLGLRMDMNKMLQQVQQMQEQMTKAQEELANETVEASAGGGMVTVTATGAGDIVGIKLAREAVDPDDVEMLQDLILAAINEALETLQKQQAEMMAPLAGGLQLPGLL